MLLPMTMTRAVLPLALASTVLWAIPGQAKEEDSRCAEKRVRLEELRAGLAVAKATQAEWVKTHCKLVAKPKGSATWRYWMCDGRWAGDEGAVLKSKEEIALESLIERVG